MNVNRVRRTLSALRGRRVAIVAALFLISCLGSLALVRGAGERLPDRLSDQEFWKLVSDSSEPDGYFRSDNLLSNELGFPYVLPTLLKSAKQGGVYLGVGPEQNFNYIAALKPKMVFIIDVRRGNLDLQMMYKALFELSDNRAEFVSRLFSKKRPQNLGTRSTPQEIFGAYEGVEHDLSAYDENLKAIDDQLTVKHHFGLSADDLKGIEYVYKAFYTYGPELRYSSTQGGYGGFRQPTYADLMESADDHGDMRSYLSTEENFSILKDLERKNLLVPVVGNFGGPKAIRAVGEYLKDHGATVSAFYLSNVEQYLWRDGIWAHFCTNVAMLPLDETSTFIRAVRGGRYGAGYGQGFGLDLDLVPIAAEVKDCKAAGSRQ